MSFADLKKKSATRLQELKQKVEDQNKGGFTEAADAGEYWKPTVNEEGNGFAVIRFLPAPEGEDNEWIRYWDHGFQGKGGWYIEKSLTTIGQKDPVAEMNSRLWATGLDSDKQIVQGVNGKNATKRRLHHVSNIYVVSDPKAPHNEGKTFKYDYGAKIFAKIDLAMNPDTETEPDAVAINPFNPFTGANFRLKIRKVQGQRNYDESKFDAPSELLGGDEKKLEAVEQGLYSLKALLDPINFKSHADLEARLVKVMGDFVGSGVAVVEGKGEAPRESAPSRPAPTQRATAAPTQPAAAIEEDEDDAEFFRRAAQG